MPDLESLLALALEAEGLIMLLRERGADDAGESDFPAQKVLEMLHDKVCLMAGMTQGEQAADSACPEEAAEEAAEAAEAEAAEFEEREDAEPEPEPEPLESKEEEEPAAEPEEEPAAEPEEHVDEEAKAVHHPVFTLNDRFRFRRELFGNNDSDMADALNLIATMASFDEAEEYFYTDLCWDPQNADVADFMAIVKNAFK